MLIKEKKGVQYISIDEASDGQRVDNFLIKILKKVPKSHIYKILRSGEVRVNKKRVKSDFKLTLDDEIRVPPLAMDEGRRIDTPLAKHNIQDSIIFEDDVLIALNKPAGIAVHGGSGIQHGVIELLRHERPSDSFLELVHRIDKETSGILLIAKKKKCFASSA
jgi:23S rRNA pseudouridine955/2504/2580 synthase